MPVPGGISEWLTLREFALAGCGERISYNYERGSETTFAPKRGSDTPFVSGRQGIARSKVVSDPGMSKSGV